MLRALSWVPDLQCAWQLLVQCAPPPSVSTLFFCAMDHTSVMALHHTLVC